MLPIKVKKSTILTYTAGHEGIIGSEWADELARKMGQIPKK